MNKKIWLGVAVAVVVVVVVLAIVFSRHGTDSALKIGATLPLSGDAAVWGKNTKEGIDLAVEEINAKGGVLGRKLEIVYEDTRALPKDGVSAYHKLVSIDKVNAIIDDSVSSVTLAMAPLAKRDQVVILATGATAPKISEAGVFRIWNSDSYEGEVIANYAFGKLGLRRVAILYINNDYGKGLESVFKELFTAHGGQIAASEGFGQSSTDIRAQLSKIKSANPDGLYLVGYPKEIPIALRQSKELGLTAKLLGTVAMHDPQLIQTAGAAAEGLVFPYPKKPTGEQAKDFKMNFRKKYGKDPGITSDVGYDAAKMIAAAIANTGNSTGEHIRKGLRLLVDYQGASGVMTFDKNGDVHKPMGMMAVTRGEFTWQDQ